MNKKLHLIYFSPTGTTRSILRIIANGFEGYEVIQHDLTAPANAPELTITDGVAIFGLPVYGGRAQSTALKRMKKIKGDKTPAVVVGVYGNRDYEDAVVELRDFVSGAGFIPVAGGAFIGEHSYSDPNHKIAYRRPDKMDKADAKAFGKSISEKLEKGDMTVPKMKGNVPYKDVMLMKGVTPKTDYKLCKLCGTCVKACPTAAVKMKDRVSSDADLCIMCMACVKVCKMHARSVYNAKLLERKEMLVKNCSERKKPQIFI